MAFKILDKCINCGACESECPNHAIYEGGRKWTIGKGTNISGFFVLMDGTDVAAEQKMAPYSSDVYYVVPSKCTECQGFFDEPQCASVCPVDSCVPDLLYPETVDELLSKKVRLHG
ncbi:4Fe-4S dicluster domain-containing protein [Chitinophagaceae bacterium LB-8]|uniref:4Fe-4S dicluster domain-containing protein n=1 Tax=Paraflavisolibacter caeni TaxID=2982496 RepID=A0A9X2Y0Y6_9BACT|nr:4Fe-4S binding protein [Paraflavisolibacter caeni]MCU7551133.1 4Fe-4S dicluster domain-containing protein [Paraflavisolibacter caeni]